MNRCTITIAVCLCGILGGCDGGGSNGEEEDFLPLLIDAANAVEVAGVVIDTTEGIIGLGGVTAAPITATRVSRLQTRVDLVAFTQRLGRLTLAGLQSRSEPVRVPATVPPPTFACSSGGNATLLYNDVPPTDTVSANDSAFVVFDNCVQDGLTVSGQVDVRITAAENPAEIGTDTADWSLTFEVRLATDANGNNFAPLRFSFEGEVFDVSGVWTSMLTFTTATATTTSRIDAFSISATADDDFQIIQNYVGVLAESEASSDYQFEADFMLQAGVPNYLCVDTQQAFAGLSPDRPGGGRLVAQTVSFEDLNPPGASTRTCADLLTSLTGSSQLTLTVMSASGPNAVRIDVDSDLDGVTDDTVFASWSALD